MQHSKPYFTPDKQETISFVQKQQLKFETDTDFRFIQYPFYGYIILGSVSGANSQQTLKPMLGMQNVLLAKMRLFLKMHNFNDLLSFNNTEIKASSLLSQQWKS